MAAIEIGAGASLGEGGRYRLQRLLGTGGMASVWLASDARLEREVAIKVLADVLALDSGWVTRFEREARLAARLSHPHLVSIFDFSVHGARPYLVLEYIAGGSLADRLGTVPRPDWDPVVLARELLDAIGYIHDAGIIHRDIKPANVLIGEDGRARLTDFGIAQPSDATRITRTGLVIGTQRYIAPEVMAGHPADERSDLYACGVLLGECLTLGAARELSRLVGLLTEPDPRLRPPSAREAIAMLDRPARATATAVASTRVLPRSPRREPPRVPANARVASQPRVTRSTSRLPLRQTPTIAAAIATAVLALALVLLLTAGGGSATRPPASHLVAPPASAPLSQQLARLDQAIGQSRR